MFPFQAQKKRNKNETNAGNQIRAEGIKMEFESLLNTYLTILVIF